MMNPVITGIGVVAPTGIGVAEHWQQTLTRTCRLGPVEGYDASGLPIGVVGQVPGFDPAERTDSKLRVQTDRWTWYALEATRLALADAALDPADHDPYRLAVVTASASGGNEFGQREIHALWGQGPRAVSAYQSIGWFYAASSGQISIKEQLKGSCGVIVSDAAGGLDALAAAGRSIRRGVGAVVVGGTEAPLSPYAIVCQSSQPGLSTGKDPATAYRPFAADATGHVPGEGGAMLIMESPGFAAERGATAYAEVAGTAATHDAHHPTDPAPDHRQLARALRTALDRAGCAPDEVGAVFADGAGDPRLDRLEEAAIDEVFGPGGVAVCVPKTMVGRLCSGGAALDVAWAALALRHGVLPPSVNLDGVATSLDLVTESRPAPELRHVVVLARGVGGFNAAAVLRRPGT
ncbi:beta-ketoacyl synthase N-terminal-like domain-containing protein [Microlunatus parietis]|uniref:3-oxoacyl-(Acyl-carrier-protein) synthase n=1 Tax=Microlunatus parietis TaxID=682979 RepID=A0A7Y9IA47_9ACTN|nr:beta-ketoacyl synthase N-terminal-like domain-containing protein [Microlunatus parietis]NYE73113.1 3-oxoacyl-(acyl-carrier-protein) synthase [Microlunatus parietis]